MSGVTFSMLGGIDSMASEKLVEILRRLAACEEDLRSLGCVKSTITMNIEVD